jgi:5,10-methylenetetrahydromethanopterin reductase
MALVTAPEMDDIDQRLVAHYRFVTYLQIPGGGDAYIQQNRWDESIADKLRTHPLFADLAGTPADHKFRREYLLEPAALIPDSWMRDSCAPGSLDNCVQKLTDFKAVGVDEFAFYATTPQQNAGLLAAWRDLA